jgi:phage shock protein PspC (stress-responsive transcriptional regulator)
MEPKKLFRSNNNKIIAGICAGIAEYLNADINIIRVLFMFVTFFWGTGILLYLILWVLIPVNESEHNNEAFENNNVPVKKNLLLIFGITILAFGTFSLFSLIGGMVFKQIFFLPFGIVPFFEILFALSIIALGLYVVFGYVNKKDQNENTNQKVLSKSFINKKIFGVCAGIAEYFKIDPTIVRVVWIIFSFISFGIAVILYLVLGIILPNDQIIKRSI